MAIIKTIPSKRIINGNIIETSEISIVSELEYSTNGEACILTKGVPESRITLDSDNTDHVVVKAMTKTIVKPKYGKIDEEYDEIFMDIYSCVEFKNIGNIWYILSSDGLKQS
jgi:hypothetical protein